VGLMCLRWFWSLGFGLGFSGRRERSEVEDGGRFEVEI